MYSVSLSFTVHVYVDDFFRILAYCTDTVLFYICIIIVVSRLRNMYLFGVGFRGGNVGGGIFGHTLAQNGYTALISAAFEGRADCVRRLLDAGANKNVQDSVRGRSAASAAGRTSNLCLVDW